MKVIEMARRAGTPLTLTGEPTDTVGVYITPATTQGEDGVLRYEGGWRLTHESGFAITGFVMRGLSDARDLARCLGEVRPDWTDLPTDTSQWPDGLRSEVLGVINRHLRRSWLAEAEEMGAFSGATLGGSEDGR